MGRRAGGLCTEVLWFRNAQAHLGFCFGPVTAWDALPLAGLKTLTLRVGLLGRHALGPGAARPGSTPVIWHGPQAARF